MAEDSEVLLRVAAAIADRTPVDWRSCEATSPGDVSQLEALKRLEALASAYRSLQDPAAPGEDSAVPPGRHDPGQEPALFEWGHLKALEKLGDGSFGEVFRAYDPLLDRDVALKLRRPEADTPAAGRRRFIHEARRLARVRHPNVVVVHGADVHAGRVGLWTDLVTGQNLEQWLAQEGPLSADGAAVIGLDLCRALAAVHTTGLVHGDVKTTNVMRERGGRIVLMDFGAGVEMTEPGARTAGGRPFGTPAVMAPELFRGEAPSPASDLYSLGVLLYRLLSGRYPVEAATLHELQERIQRQGFVPLRDARPDLPAELVAIIERALAHSPADRYASAGAMEHALLGWLAPGPAGNGAAPAAIEAASEPRPLQRAVGWTLRRPAWQLAIATTLVAAAATTAVLLRGRLPHPAFQPTQVRSLAVLPFRGLDSEASAGDLGLGMADALINRLSHLPEISVRPTSAVLGYAEARPDPREVGKSLGVEAVLDGRIQHAGDRVRVTAQLISTAEGAPIWAATFDQKTANLFELEDSISEQLVGALRVRLTEVEKARLTWRPTTNADAYQAYLKGRYFWARWTPVSVRKSVGYFEQAIASDPAFALAWGGLADALVVAPGLEPSPAPPDEAYARARQAAGRALELDAGLAGAHAALGFVHLHHDWDWTAAEAEFKRAIELDSGCLTAYLGYSELLSLIGRHEDAIVEIRHALQIDPVSLAANALAGDIYLEAGRYEDAIQQLGRTLEIEPSFHLAYTFLAATYEREGRDDEVISHWQNAMTLGGAAPEEVASFGRAYASGGMAGAWRWRLDRLRKDAAERFVPPALVGRAHAALGQTREALSWLQRAAEEHDEFLLRVLPQPELDGLRAEAPFKAIRARLGLPEAGVITPERSRELVTHQVPTGALTMEAALNRGRDGRLVPLDAGASVRPGDHISLTLESAETVHVYILNEDRAGNTFVLFPLPGLDLTNPLPGRRRLLLPGGRAGVIQDWVVTSAGGNETILVVASRTALPELEREIAGLQSATEDRPVEALSLQAAPGGTTRGVGGLAPRTAKGPGRLERVASSLARLVGAGDAWLRRFEIDSSGS